MKFGPVPIAEAVDTILAHAVALAGRTFKKGRRLSPDDVDALDAAGIRDVVAARIEADEVPEDVAAAQIAAALFGAGIEATAAFTGRVNLHAANAGLMTLDSAVIDRINRIDEAVTVATLPAFAPVEPRQMVATVKIIPFAVKRASLDAVLAVLAESGPAIAVAAFRPARAALIQTRLPGLKDTVIAKTAEVVAARLAGCGGRLVEQVVVPHDEVEVAARLRRFAAAGCSPLLVIGASAATDRRDVVPAAMVAAGGRIDHFGMPVDPGNLLVLGQIGETPVIGLPGCARSPKFNGFDMVLQRLLAGLAVTAADIQGLGVGGLLGEIASRPQPRAGSATPSPFAPKLAAVVLAAGGSTRMGGANKLLVDWRGRPMVEHPVRAALDAGFDPVVVVTGHQDDRVEAALADLPVSIVHNPRWAAGLSTSLRAGIRALPRSVDGAVVLLGDMPRIRTDHLGRLAAAFAPEEGRSIVVPTRSGSWGNPLLWGRRFFEEIATLDGDRGARTVARAASEFVAEVEMSDDAIFVDVDTPEALVAASSAA